MARKYVLLDDYDGKELPDDTEAVQLSLGRTTYNLHLSEDNYGKLLEVLEPFIKDAETTSTRTAAAAPSRGSNAKADRDRLKKIRAWAQETGYKFKGADGEERTLGDRGRIPEEVISAYEAANPDD